METINLVWILPLYFFVFLAISFLFTFQVQKIAQGKWSSATAFSMASEFIFFFTMIMASLLLDVDNIPEIAMIFMVGFMSALGNMTGTYLTGLRSDKNDKKSDSDQDTTLEPKKDLLVSDELEPQLAPIEQIVKENK